MRNLCKKLFFLSPLVVLIYYFTLTQSPSDMPNVQTCEDIAAQWPTTAQAIHKLAEQTQTQALNELDALYAIPLKDRTFSNTILKLDRILANASIKGTRIEVLSMVSPLQEVRDAALEAVKKLQDFFIDHFSQNEKTYAMIKQYYEHSMAQNESLRPSQKKLIEDSLDSFKRSGLQKPQEIRDRIKALEKELALQAVTFEHNIAASNKTITVSRQELEGVNDNFVNAVKQTPEGLYIVGTDYPSMTAVLEECTVSTTRKQLSKAFSQRGYPENKEVLATIIKLRHDLAQLLDYPSYAHLDIDKQMAQNPERVSEFLHTLKGKASSKAEKEFEQLKADLPDGISLSPSGKIYPWDLAYIKRYHKKKFDLDDSIVAEYFPLDYTLPALLEIYEKFFDVTFKKAPTDNKLWHPEVQLLSVYKNNKLLGSVLLDLFPRDNKYTHACEVTIIPSVKSTCPGLVAVIANFPKAQGDAPALLKHSNMVTFFHEFGHALHALLGSRKLASHCGTHVKGDFVEMPSQMLEHWMWQPEILKMVSRHYKTHEPLPDAMIEKMLSLKNFGSGSWVMQQIVYGLTSLQLFSVPTRDNQDAYLLWKKLYTELLPSLEFDEENHGYCSFGHLTGYGAKYYGYLWSQIFAADLFEHIKQHGILSKTIGAKYIHDVIGKGGARDPEDLLRIFLGREPRADAFFIDLGL